MAHKLYIPLILIHFGYSINVRSDYAIRNILMPAKYIKKSYVLEGLILRKKMDFYSVHKKLPI